MSKLFPSNEEEDRHLKLSLNVPDLHVIHLNSISETFSLEYFCFLSWRFRKTFIFKWEMIFASLFLLYPEANLGFIIVIAQFST